MIYSIKVNYWIRIRTSQPCKRTFREVKANCLWSTRLKGNWKTQAQSEDPNSHTRIQTTLIQVNIWLLPYNLVVNPALRKVPKLAETSVIHTFCWQRCVTDFWANAYINSSHGVSIFDTFRADFDPDFLTMTTNRIILVRSSQMGSVTVQSTDTVYTKLSSQVSNCKTREQLRSFQKGCFNHIACLLFRQRVLDCAVKIHDLNDILRHLLPRDFISQANLLVGQRRSYAFKCCQSPQQRNSINLMEWRRRRTSKKDQGNMLEQPRKQ